MSCRGKSRTLPPTPWVTLRGGLCSRRNVKNGFQRAVFRKQESKALCSRPHSPSKSPVCYASCVKNRASAEQPRRTLLGDVGESVAEVSALKSGGGETESRVGKAQLDFDPARQEQVRVVSVEPSSDGPAVRRSEETCVHHGSPMASSLPAGKVLNPLLFHWGAGTPSVACRASALPAPTFVRAVSRGAMGREMAYPHDLMQQRQTFQALSTVQKDATTQGDMLPTATTASSPPTRNDSQNHTLEGSIHKEGLGSVLMKESELHNMVTAPPERSREQSLAFACPSTMQRTVGGQQDSDPSLGRGYTNPAQLQQPFVGQQDPSMMVGRKRKADDLMVGEERLRKNNGRSDDVTLAASCAAPSPPSADDDEATVPVRAKKPTTVQVAANVVEVEDDSEEELFGEAAHCQYEDTPDNALLTNGDVRHEDVLCGRGAHATHHTGNRAFRNDISRLLPQYAKASKLQKTELADAVVKKVTKRGGRFLKRLEVTSTSEEACRTKGVKKRSSTYDEDNIWEVLSYNQSRSKVSQRFRQAGTYEKSEEGE